MIKNYFLTAFRNIIRNRLHSFINLIGLAAGMAVALLIGLWIWDELSFNKYHNKYDSIGRIMRHMTVDGETISSPYVPYPLAVELKTTWRQQFNEVLVATAPEQFDLSVANAEISMTGQFIDKEAPAVLGLQMIKGTVHGLHEPHSVILSASMAYALFGKQDPLGNIVNLNIGTPMKVTGIFEDLPGNTYFAGTHFFAPFELYQLINPWVKQQSWDNQFLLAFTVNGSGKQYEAISAAIKHAEIDITSRLDNYREQAARKPEVFIQPMRDWHLHGNFINGRTDQGPVRFVWLVGLIGVFVLLLACINFMNLSTARSEKRAKEVGVRKAIGSGRRQLILQFYCEAICMTLFSFATAVLMVTALLPWFNEISAKQLQLPWQEPAFYLCCGSFIVITGLLAGSYPALYLSSFQPIQVLKGTFRAGRLAAVPRKTLVVVQFSISVILIICTIIVYQQVVFASDRPLGFNDHGLLMIRKKSANFKGKTFLLGEKLKSNGTITAIAEGGGPITEVWQWNGGFTWKNKNTAADPSFGTLAVTHAFGTTVGWDFVMGRDFSASIPGDSSTIVINESAARLMGLQDPVGEWIRWKTDSRAAQQYQVIGVIRDMVMESPFEKVVPTIFRLDKELGWIYLRINPGISFQTALANIENTFRTIIPGVPFDYRFADVEFKAKFEAEERIGKLAAFFASLAVLISSLGLFGLSSYTAEQRTKEIGVRKVLGASVGNVWTLLSKDYLQLILIALLIAVPIAWYAMHQWLENYQYRVALSWWVFAGTAIAAILYTLAIVSFYILKAATTNPAKTLRTE